MVGDVLLFTQVDDVGQRFATILQAHLGSNQVVLVGDDVIDLLLDILIRDTDSTFTGCILVLVHHLLQIDQVFDDVLLLQISSDLHQVLRNFVKDEFVVRFGRLGLDHALVLLSDILQEIADVGVAQYLVVEVILPH